MNTLTSVIAMAAMVAAMGSPADAGTFLIDLGTSSGSAAGWNSFNSSVTDASITDTDGVDNDVTLSIGTVGGNSAVAGVVGGTAVNGISVPSAAWNDYLYTPAPYIGLLLTITGNVT